MPRPQISVGKRQREQAKRERMQLKTERRAERKRAKVAEGGEASPDADSPDSAGEAES